MFLLDVEVLLISTLSTPTLSLIRSDGRFPPVWCSWGVLGCREGRASSSSIPTQLSQSYGLHRWLQHSFETCNGGQFAFPWCSFLYILLYREQRRIHKVRFFQRRVRWSYCVVDRHVKALVEWTDLIHESTQCLRYIEIPVIFSCFHLSLEFTCGVISQLLWILPAKIFPSWECAKLCFFQAEHDT